PAIEFPRGMPNDKPHLMRLAIYSKERPDLKVQKISSSRPGLIVAEAKPLTAEEAKQLKVEKGYTVIVEIKPGMPLGIFHDELVLYTDHPKMPEVKLPVGGHMDGPISVTPPGLWMHDVVSRKGASRDLTLIVRGGKVTKIEVAEKPEKLDIEIEQA